MKLNLILKMTDSKEATSTKIFARNPVCMLCLESKDIRHFVKIRSEAGGLPFVPPFIAAIFTISFHANLSRPQFLGVFWVM